MYELYRGDPGHSHPLDLGCFSSAAAVKRRLGATAACTPQRSASRPGADLAEMDEKLRFHPSRSLHELSRSGKEVGGAERFDNGS